MKFYSIKDPGKKTEWGEAILNGLSPDGGLYLPCEIPQVNPGQYDFLRGLSFEALACNILHRWIGEELDEAEFKKITKGVFDFPVEIVNIDGKNILELFHGPSLSFKDFGARFLAASLEAILEKQNKDAILITATSGDTGAAVAKAFANSNRVKTYILYPTGMISDVQEKQIATSGGNVTAISVEADFDACQRLVKKALNDENLKTFYLTSANSINIGRLLPQTTYYIYAYLKLAGNKEKLLVSVPCGNFGNLTAGLLARRMGFPLGFVAACNENAIATAYLESGRFKPHATRQTLSSAMDIGDPSNFARILALYNNDKDAFATDIKATKTTDAETLETIKNVFEEHSYILDPHGAVAWHGLTQAGVVGTPSIAFETAHPAKFPETVKDAINKTAQIPESLKKDLAKQIKSKKIPADYSQLIKLLKNR